MSCQPVIPGTDTPTSDLVEAFLDGADIPQLAERFNVPGRVIEQVLRGELRVLLWLHGSEDRPGPEPLAAPAPPPVPAAPASPAPAPSRPLVPRRSEPDVWTLPAGRTAPRPRWTPEPVARPHVGDLTYSSSRSVYRRLLDGAHERAACLDAQAGSDSPWSELIRSGA